MSSPIRRTEDDDDAPFSRPPPWLSAERPVAPRSPDASEPTFSGDRAMIELGRRLSLQADIVPEPPLDAYGPSTENQRSMMWRFLSLVGIAAAIAWAIVLLPTLKKNETEITPTHVRETPTEPERTNPVDSQGAAKASLPAPYGSAAVSQPPVVAAMPPSDARAQSVPVDQSLGSSAANLAPSPVPKPVAPAASRAAGSGSALGALNNSAAAAPPPASLLNPNVTAPLAPSNLPSFQARTASAAPATASTSLDPASAQTPAQLAPAPVPNKNVPALEAEEVAVLLSRGKDFLSAGDISSAQLLFRRAAESDSAEAALLLASTYDPRYLAAHNAVGVVGDEVKARAWYQRAAELGSPEAARMLAQRGVK